MLMLSQLLQGNWKSTIKYFYQATLIWTHSSLYQLFYRNYKGFLWGVLDRIEKKKTVTALLKRQLCLSWLWHMVWGLQCIISLNIWENVKLLFKILTSFQLLLENTFNQDVVGGLFWCQKLNQILFSKDYNNFASYHLII